MSSSTSSSDRADASDRGDPATAGAGTSGYLARVLATALVGALLLACVNWLTDPLQLYRAASGTPVWSENQRYQIPGLAKHYDYETIVVGTSHAENFLPSDVEARLGEKAVNLAIAGSTAREQRLVVEKALETGRVGRVVWLLDRIAFSKPPDALGGAGDDFPMHLYRETLRTPLLYLLSTDTLVLSVASWLGRGPRDLDTLNAWHADFTFGPRPLLADWRRRLSVLSAVRARTGQGFRDPTPTVRRSVARNLVEPIRAHPGVRFDLVFPPYSVLSYLADFAHHPTAFTARQRYKAAVVAATAELANVRVLDFQGQTSISQDFSHYKDLEHFDLAVNRLILEAIASGEHVVDSARYAEQLAVQAAQVERYREAVCAPGSTRRALCPTPGRRPGRP